MVPFRILGQKRSIETHFCGTAFLFGHALANFALQRILSEKLQYLCFSQVPAGSDCPHRKLYRRNAVRHRKSYPLSVSEVRNKKH